MPTALEINYQVVWHFLLHISVSIDVYTHLTWLQPRWSSLWVKRYCLWLLMKSNGQSTSQYLWTLYVTHHACRPANNECPICSEYGPDCWMIHKVHANVSHTISYIISWKKMAYTFKTVVSSHTTMPLMIRKQKSIQAILRLKCSVAHYRTCIKALKTVKKNPAAARHHSVALIATKLMERDVCCA